MKARRTTAAMDRPTRAPMLGREDQRELRSGGDIGGNLLDGKCCRCHRHQLASTFVPSLLALGCLCLSMRQSISYMPRTHHMCNMTCVSAAT